MNEFRLFATENAAALLKRQMVETVQWQAVIERLTNNEGVGKIIEIGPKQVLTGIIKAIRPGYRVSFAGDARTIADLR